MTDAELWAIRARCVAASPPPWRPETGACQCLDEDYDLWYGRGPMRKVVGFKEGKRAATPDAEFIAHARDDIPALLAEVARLREEAGARR